MPLCGFNQKMLEGLAAFHEGLVEHGLIERSKKKNQTTEQTINIELKDMDKFLKETHNLTEPEIRELTEALVGYASAYYKFVQKNGVNNYKKIIQFLNDFYFIMDDKYYSDLEGKPNDMKRLAEHLNEIRI